MRQKHIYLICPCGSDLHYEVCCALYIDAGLAAPTPEALVRSRYTAFTQANIDYVFRTSRGNAKKTFDRDAAIKWVENTEWVKLTITKTSPIKENDTIGYVEFIAEFKENGENDKVHERSRFEKINDTWYYTDGISLSESRHCHDEHCHECETERPIKKVKIGRNEPCACGSGKKYKKCCLLRKH